MNPCEILIRLYENPRDDKALMAAIELGPEGLERHISDCEVCKQFVEQNFRGTTEKIKAAFMVEYSLRCEKKPEKYSWDEREKYWEEERTHVIMNSLL